LFVVEPESCCLLELRAAKSRFCCCGVKRKLGGKVPPVPVEAITSDETGYRRAAQVMRNYMKIVASESADTGWI
jgi:hypothetical protein